MPKSQKPRKKMSKAKQDRLNPPPEPERKPLFADQLEAMKEMFKDQLDSLKEQK